MSELLSELEIADELAAHALAGTTRRAYTGHVRAWQTWCAQRGVLPLPADVDALREHLAGYAVAISDGQVQRDADGRLVPSRAAVTVGIRLAAIDKLHALAGLARPSRDEHVRMLMAGLRRAFGVRPLNKRAPLTLDRLDQLLVHIRAGSTGNVQDRVLLLLAVRLRPTAGQLSRLRWTDVRIDEKSVHVQLPASRRGAKPTLVTVAVHADDDLCLRASLLHLQIRSGGSEVVLRGRGGLAPLTRQALHQRLLGLPAELTDPGVNPARRDALLRRLLPPRQDPGLKGLRDAALLLTGFAAALRCDNLVSLNWGDVDEEDDGQVRLLLTHSKTDQEGVGEYVWLPLLDDDADALLCPAKAFNAWRRGLAAALGGDPRRVCPTAAVFPSLTPGGEVRTRSGAPVRMRADSVNELIRSLAVAAGLHDPSSGDRNRFGGHSLRAGYATQAARDGQPLQKIQAVTKHKSLDVLMGYIREEDLRRDNPARQLFSRRPTPRR